MGRSTVKGLLLLILLVATLPRSAGADSWEHARKAVIDPINGEFHRHLPKYLQQRDLDSFVALYDTERGTGLRWESERTVYPGFREQLLRWEGGGGDEPIRERYQRLLDRFTKIEKAELRIHRIHWDEDGGAGWPADVRLIVRGTRATDGAAAQLDQHMRWRISQRGKDWRITAEEVTARELTVRAAPAFELATEKTGIRDVHTNEGSPGFRMIGGTKASAGSAVGDVDGDGCEDLFLPGSPDARLYRNLCDGTFRDITEAVGLPHPFPAVATGTVFIDYDNDGRPDLFVAAAKGGNRLFHNVAGGAEGVRFIDVTAAAGIPEDPWSSMPVAADYDRDGLLDLYIVRMGDHGETSPRPNYEARNGLPNRLLHNDGNGTFSDATDRAGVGDRGWGLAGAWGDFDDDGWTDLYVANEYGFSVLYRNQHDGTFRDVSAASGALIRTAGMGVAFGDVDGDGHLDVFVSAMYANSRWALFHPDFPAPIPWGYKLLGFFTAEVRRRTEGVIEDLTGGSSLFHNRGDGTLANVSEASGVRDAQWGWGAEFLDYDNDGRLDLFSQNGFITGELPDDV